MFNRLRAKALAAAEVILDIRLEPDHPKFTEILTRQSSVIASVLAATARVTPSRLRGQEVNHMDEIVETVKAQKEVLRSLT